ncbi:MAG: hypothetical protein H5U40_06505, partial [Polyangiaceae bacterium]|nr:hypothetical protein [Polyangiaceae bacterium]
MLEMRIDEGEPTRIEELRFEGDDLPRRDGGARRALGLVRGDILDQRDLENRSRAAERKLREVGFLEARLGPAVVERDGARAVVSVASALGRHYEVRVIGHAPIARDEVIEALELTTDPLSRAVAETMEHRVSELYRRNGFVDVQVRVRRLAKATPGEAQLLVEIAPGASLEVIELTFPGSDFFERRFLHGQVGTYLNEAIAGDRFTSPVDPDVVDRLVLGTRERGRDAPRPYASDPARVYFAEAYEDAIEHIAELYEAEGFLSARVGPHRLERLDSSRARVEIPIDEGPRTTIHVLSIDGNARIGTRDIAVAAALVRGRPFSR